MTAMLDPWNDADTLAERLSHSDALLFVLIGAEQWCSKCRDIRPRFDALMAQAQDHETWLRFDLEEHADFLGDYLPEGLPMLVIYQGNTLLACEPVKGADDELSLTIVKARKNASGGSTYRPDTTLLDPGIHLRLVTQNWAD